MKVILTKPVPSLGKTGDTVNVSDGHARNFLFPRKLAVPATQAASAQVAQQRESTRREKQRAADKYTYAAQTVQGKTLLLKAKANEEGRLYAAVHEKRIAEELKKKYGVEVSPKSVHLPQAVKEIGTWKAEIRFPGGLKAQFAIQIESAN